MKQLPRDKKVLFNTSRKSNHAVHRRRSKQHIKKPATNEISSVKPIILGVIAILLLVLIIYAIITFLNSPKFKINEFSYLGNKSITESQLNQALQEYLAKNIFFARSEGVENLLLEEFVYFNNVKVRKIWPNKLEIVVNEREPKLILINISGIYLVDEDGRMISTLAEQEINLSEQQLDVVRGLGNPNAKYIEERLEVKFIEENPELDPETDFKFKDIPLSKKIEELQEMQAELSEKVSSTLATNAEQISDTEYEDLQRVFAYENKQYEKFSYINDELLMITLEITNFFANNPKEEQVKQVTWISEFLVRADLTNGKQITFGSGRSITTQLEDYRLIKSQLKLKGEEYSKIDLSSDKISVK